ncbi:hypothetical protein O181_117502 [Austropuccinia psidii MF-1]|uniref:Uncharacterized protein n=1 Tax=Austropuccinia psidii MF-1 TaxID=1389203 RepID=A0A9Q3KDG9_9BASI|nr:hypothetical protein [Austropuccinia psidii MF-1]
MVHNRNGSNFSVQSDGCGQRRGKTKLISETFSSRKTHLEDSRVSPHSPRSAPTQFDVNSESELIHDNISRAEPFSSGRNRNLSMPIQELVQSSQRGGVESMPKPLAGGHELLLTHQELCGSGEDHRTLINQKELEMTPALEKEGPVESNSFKPAPEVSKDNPNRPQRKKVPRTIREKAKAKKIGIDLTHKGTGSLDWSLQLWTVSSIWPELSWNSQSKSRKG